MINTYKKLELPWKHGVMQISLFVARTDAEAVLGLEEAIARVEGARDLGADASFVEAPGSLEQLKEIGKRVPKPMVANMIEGGKTPVLALKKNLPKWAFS